MSAPIGNRFCHAVAHLIYLFSPIVLSLGYIKMTSLFIEHGATTAILNNKGTLFTSPEYEGVRLQIETHRSAQTKQIMKLVADKSKKALYMLEKLWVVGIEYLINTIKILSFRTNKSEQIVQTQIRLLLEEQSDLGLHFLLFHLHLFDEMYPKVWPLCLSFR